LKFDYHNQVLGKHKQRSQGATHGHTFSPKKPEKPAGKGKATFPLPQAKNCKWRKRSLKGRHIRPATGKSEKEVQKENKKPVHTRSKLWPKSQNVNISEFSGQTRLDRKQKNFSKYECL